MKKCLHIHFQTADRKTAGKCLLAPAGGMEDVWQVVSRAISDLFSVESSSDLFSNWRIKTLLLFVLACFAFNLESKGQDPWLLTAGGNGLGYYDYVEADATTFINFGTNYTVPSNQGFVWADVHAGFPPGTGFDYLASKLGIVYATPDLVRSNHGADWTAGASIDLYCKVTDDLGVLRQTVYNNEMMLVDVQKQDITGYISNAPKQLVLQFAIDAGTNPGRELNRLWVANDGTLLEGNGNNDINFDQVRLYYETGTTFSFNGTESYETLYGDYAGDPTNNNRWGHNALNSGAGLSIPSDGVNKLLCYVVIENFNGSFTAGRTAQFKIENDGMNLDQFGGLNALGLVRIDEMKNSNALPFGPIHVAGSNASSNGDYATLAAAFGQINSFTQLNNNIVITINGSTTEPVAGGILLQNTFGVWTSLKIYPTAPGYVINGAASANPVIDLDGADNVTLDGRVNQLGAIDLTITKPSSTSVIRLLNNATNNIITYCKLLGPSGANGVINFSTSVVGGNGNDDNTVSYCDIGPSGGSFATYPQFLINSSGTVGRENSSNTILNCNIHDFYHTSQSHAAINIVAGNTAWTIDGNSIYQTASYSVTGNISATGILINNNTGNDFIVRNNKIGGNSPNCNGTWTINGTPAAYKFEGIYISAGTGTNTVVNNTIKGFSWLTSSSAGFSGSLPGVWCGIHVFGTGNVTVGSIGNGNTIGDNSTNSVLVTAGTSGASGAVTFGIGSESTGNVSIQNNFIGSITTTGSTTSISSGLVGIRVSAGNNTINNNTIGGAGINSLNCINASTHANTQFIRGIVFNNSNTATGSQTVNNNIISNLNNNYAGGTASQNRGISIEQGAGAVTGNISINNNTINTITTSQNAAGTAANTNVVGIHLAATPSLGVSITGNTIYDLKETATTAAVTVAGIYYSGPAGTNIISKNFIYGLDLPFSTGAAVVSGIRIAAGTTTFSNNLISLGLNTNSAQVIGLNDGGGTNSIFHNTVSLNGTANGATQDAALLSTATNARNIQNNIFANFRTLNTGNHYSVRINPTGIIAIGYNDYIGTLLGITLNTVPDNNSLTTLPAFPNPIGTTLTDYIPGATTLTGNSALIATITDDIDGTTRCIPTMGAQEKSSAPATPGAISGPTSPCPGQTGLVYSIAAVAGATSYTWTVPPGWSITSGNGTISITVTAGSIGDNGNITVTATNSCGLTSPASSLAVSIGPIQVNGDTPPTTACYATLRDAFAAINNGFHQGVITVLAHGSTTETATAVLNASGGTSSYSSVSIQPAGGGARIISGAMPAGDALVSLNGADNVTIDGLNSGGNSLTFENTTVSNLTGTCTFWLRNDATNNTITRCTILGSSTTPVGTNGGNIWIGSDAVVSGNDGNTISNTAIGPAGTNLPTKGIYFSGATTTAALNNSGTSITGNAIFDFFGDGVTSAGIYIQAGSTQVSISSNRFYQTSGRVQTTGAKHAGIWIANTSGDTYQVTNNIIGFASSLGTGTYSITGVSNTQFTPIYLNAGTTNTVQGNTIAGIAMSGTCSGTNSNAPFIGMDITGGDNNIANNTIGSATGTGSITFSNADGEMDVIGIRYESNGTGTIQNNTIGSITGTNTTANAVHIYGIYKSGGSSGLLTINNNLVGSTSTANSINAASATTAGAQKVVGISNAATGDVTITGNTIANLANAYNGAGNGSVVGIGFSGGSGSNIISKNFIYSLIPGNDPADLYGIRITGGTGTFSNNIVNMGNGISSNSRIYGISEDGTSTSNIYFNTVYIGGVVSGGLKWTYALYNTGDGNTRNFRNNIFMNARSGGSGTHYAISMVGNTGLTINYNDYFSTGSVLGRFAGLDAGSLAAWQGSTFQDANSVSVNPAFANAGGTALVDYISSDITLTGNAIAGIADDIDGTTRCVPSMGAQENALTPSAPGAISGTITQCAGVTGQVYSITSVPSATTYTWSVPTGWSITLGQGTISITVTAGAAGQNGNISVTAGNSCGTSAPATLAVTVNPAAPATPGPITGVTPQCPSVAGQVYSVPAVAGATTYTWSVPTGWTISSGAGTNSITVTTGSLGQNGNITVTAGNSCGTSAAGSMAVTVEAAPGQPGAISGPVSACVNSTGNIYSIAAVPGATGYTWTVPTGWTVTAGAGTPSITVTAGALGQNGTISVAAISGCGTSTASTLNVVVVPFPTGTNAVTTTCSGGSPNFALTASVPSTFTWTIGTIAGGITGASAGSGNTINQVLTNPNSTNGTVDYIVVPTSVTGSCVGAAFTVQIIVEPAPTITLVPDATYCSGSLVPAINFSSLPGSTFAWTSSNDIGFGTFGTGNIPTFSALNTTGSPLLTTISVIATHAGCVGPQMQFQITVNPSPEAYITADYCSTPGSIILTAHPVGLNYVWSTGATTQTIIVNVANVYSVIVTNPTYPACQSMAFLPVATELVIDGTFTNFNAASPAFASLYTQHQAYCTGAPPSGLFDEGTYAVNTQAWYDNPLSISGYHPQFHGKDHTNNSIGARNFMMVNGSVNPAQTIWQQVVAIQPNTAYYFSAWGMNLNPGSPAQLRFEITTVQNGTQQVGTIADLNVAQKPTTEAQVSLANWVRFYSNPTWTSPPGATSATIRIINLNTIAGGNDFGLDDISFGTLAITPASVSLSASGGGGGPVCEGGTINLTANISGGLPPYANFSWTGPNGFTSNFQNPSPILNVTSANAGDYHFSFTDGYGCSPQTFTITVTVNPQPILPTNVQVDRPDFCEDDPGNIILSAASGAGTTLKWYTGSCGGTLIGTGSPISIASPAISTTYYVRGENTCGNSACLSVAVAVYTLPTVLTSITGPSMPVCVGSSITLNANGGNGGTGTNAVLNWYSNACGSAVIGTGTTLTITVPAVSTTYYARWQSDCGVTACQSFNVTVTQLPVAPTSASCNPPYYCENSIPASIVLSVPDGSGSSLNWYTGGCAGVLIGSGNNLTINSPPISTTSYYARWETPGCGTSACASVTVTVRTLPTAPTSVTATPDNLCAGASLSLQAFGGNGGTGLLPVISWYPGSCGGTSIGTGPILNITAPASNTTYYAQWENGCGSSACASASVTIQPLPGGFSVIGTPSVCIPATGIAYSATSANATSYSWSYSGTGVTINGTGTNVTLDFTAAATNGTLQVIASNSCGSVTNTRNITVGSPPVVNAGPDQSDCAGQTFTLAGSSSIPINNPLAGWFTSGTGTFNNSHLLNAIYTPSALDIANGTVTLTLTSNDPPGACTAVSDQMVITIRPRPIPVIIGPTPLCVNSALNLYSTEPGKTNYVWSVSAGGTVTSGGGTTNSTVTVTWNASGAQTVSVNYTDVNGCAAAVPTVFIVTVNPLPSTSAVWHN